jgi:hypothetical protein
MNLYFLSLLDEPRKRRKTIVRNIANMTHFTIKRGKDFVSLGLNGLFLLSGLSMWSRETVIQFVPNTLVDNKWVTMFIINSHTETTNPLRNEVDIIHLDLENVRKKNYVRRIALFFLLQY